MVAVCKIFFFSSHAAADMSFLLVDIKNFSCLAGKFGINLRKSGGYVLMYCGFADSKFVSSLADSSLGIYNVLASFNGSFFNIGFHKNPCIICFYSVCRGGFEYVFVILKDCFNSEVRLRQIYKFTITHDRWLTEASVID